MGRFDAILLCSDLDDTLLTTEKTVSAQNKQALEYFMAEGGHFAFATGRVPRGARLILEYIVPNSPIICFNGAGIYDYSTQKLLWERSLDDSAYKIIELIEQELPQAGIEVCTRDDIFFCRTNRIVREHQQIERFADNYADFRDIHEVWKKIIFMTEQEEVEIVRKLIARSEFAQKYDFVQSSPWYYEVLPKGATKGDALLELARILGIDQSDTIAIGDSENDLSMIQKAGVGIAVANAMPELRSAADCITVDNNSHALAAVVDLIEKGKIHNGKII